MKLGKVKLSITLDPGVVHKLPKQNRSYAIEKILKEHYQKEGFEQLFESLRKRLIYDDTFNKWLEDTVKEIV